MKKRPAAILRCGNNEMKLLLKTLTEIENQLDVDVREQINSTK